MLLTSVPGTVQAAAHNPLIPSTPDLIWGALCFVIVLFFFWKYALPRVKQTLDARTEAIEGGIKKAEQAQADAAAALDEYNAQLAAARAESQQIREHARAEGAEILADLKQQAQHEAERITTAARAQIEVDRKSAFDQLKSEIGVLSIDLASSIVGQSLGEDAKAKAVVDRFITDLDGQPSTEAVK